MIRRRIVTEQSISAAIRYILPDHSYALALYLHELFCGIDLAAIIKPATVHTFIARAQPVCR